MEPDTPKESIRILHVEDNPMDAALVSDLLRGADFQSDILRLCDRKSIESALTHSHFDVIVCDFSLPGFDGMEVLEIAKNATPQTPFIFVSGKIGEETAVESLQKGAVDYVLKDRIGRLPGAIKRALDYAACRTEEVRLSQLTYDQANLLEQTSDAILALDNDFTISYCNRSAETLFSTPRALLIGQPGKEILFPQDAQMFEIVVKELQERGSWAGTQSLRTPEKRFLEHRWNRVQHPGIGQFRVIVSVRDITEEKDLEATVSRNQRIESIGSIAAGVAHDVNNSLTPIMMGIDLLTTEAANPETIRYLKAMHQSARHCADLVSQISIFARGLREEERVVSLRSSLSDFELIFRGICPAPVRLEFSMSDELWPIQGSATKILQMLMNLCINARDAMAAGGILRVQARNLNAGSPGLPPELLGVNCVCLTVEDAGAGMAPQTVVQIFDPFFTTKSASGGTGLGLALVKKIVEEHGGRIEVTSKIGVGTQFRVYLPAFRSDDVERKPFTNGIAKIGSGQSVLLIDSELALRDLLSSVLVEAGFQVFRAEDGAAGLALFLKKRESISLIVTDLSVPYLGGRELIEIARKINPLVNALLCSGSVAVEQTHDPISARTSFLKKPFTASEFLSAVTTILGAKY
ncbi:MAG: hybrid sensor histidine kinase/response regulator [Verrucomicrobiales bacterium]|nr:hybrid sensor histidine kinase/response regulator [Verrucomicrobiales bacterium]